MTALAVNKNRTFELGVDPVYGDIPMIAAGTAYAGSAIGESASTGNARAFVDGDVFLGFATAKADNSAGAIGDVNVRVRQKGILRITDCGGTVTDDHLGAIVYLTTDNDFSITDSGSDVTLGRIVRFVGASEVYVYFESAILRSE